MTSWLEEKIRLLTRWVKDLTFTLRNLLERKDTTTSELIDEGCKG